MTKLSETRKTMDSYRRLVYLFGAIWVVGGVLALSFPSSDETSAAAVGSAKFATTTVLYFQGNTEDAPQGTGTGNCTGSGTADIVNCGGPFLSETAALSTNPSARWGPVNSALDGTSSRNIYDPNWIWYVGSPKRIGGAATLEWWASCGGCSPATSASWLIKIYDSDAAGLGAVFSTTVTVTPSAPNVVEKLTANLFLPEINIPNRMVLTIDPVFGPAQQNAQIHYDSQLPCTGATGAAACDSKLTIQVFAPGEQIPTPTPSGGGGNEPSGCAVPTFDNYQPPVGYPRRDNAGEPSIGINWNTGNVMTMSRLQANRTTFNDSTSPADPVAGVSWFPNKPATIVTGLDPIGFTDRVTGRSIFGELVAAAGSTDGIISDDDLTTTVATFQTGGPVQGFDHQTIGGGPAKPGILGRQPTGNYPHLFYYASQQAGYASVATSLDGGLTYQPAVIAYTLAQCGGIHGHIKVAPDGTVYLPNKNCGGKAAVTVSEDNGLTWEVRQIPTSTGIGGISDPSVGVGAGGRIYFSYTASNRQLRVAVSEDRGLTWRDDINLSQLFNPRITAGLFPAVVAGDNDRAAVFFLGTDTKDAGDPFGSVPTVKATWFPYVAVTCNGGKGWSVVRADYDPLNPDKANPVQQGPICTSGTTCPAGPPNTRNLLDFNDVAVDSRGRIHVVHADGCNFDHPCINITDNSGDSSTNQGAARLTIIRQRGGSRLFSAFDQTGPAPPPLPPPVFVEQTKTGSKIKWMTPDNGGSPLTAYRVYRKLRGVETMIAEVRSNVLSVVDRKNKRLANATYRVAAVNKYGETPVRRANTAASKSE